MDEDDDLQPAVDLDGPMLDNRDQTDTGKHRRAIFSVPVNVTVSVGQSEDAEGPAEILGWNVPRLV